MDFRPVLAVAALVALLTAVWVILKIVKKVFLAGLMIVLLALAGLFIYIKFF